jgi:hypothetical protein
VNDPITTEKREKGGSCRKRRETTELGCPSGQAGERAAVGAVVAGVPWLLVGELIWCLGFGLGGTNLVDGSFRGSFTNKCPAFWCRAHCERWM